MSYFAGTQGLGRLGVDDDMPRIECDKCGLVYRIRQDRPPPAWFLDGKGPKGWLVVREHDGRSDYCPGCHP